ncbi:efflux RND transporter periplasmic adaptor subunit [Permianibacter aggregans]|uniref:RND family efflux transporter MFP subunit n=1 Tax=Permianibacter aggregans TaxID=1510150 RepID=A0A4R6UII2_9GAMM|nr:efflux RND transporter periplasmic adaptor subunit [Permianibacter aggregans]QGX39931.1 HlyD family efflux transporter periplasmic adaptor subunit [Permianibacter aggregans]TDQ46262.1 RND family efflux transporter MFP subunit [Permianibacter aggregans]
MKGVALLLMLALSACSSQTEQSAAELVLQPADFSIRVQAEGELEASTATPITMPAGISEPQVLAWMQEENVRVKAGDIVAKLDEKRFQREAEQERLKISQAELSLNSREFVLGGERRSIGAELDLVREELDFASRFAVEDLRVYSRIEIIDKLANVDYLQSRQAHQQWRNDRHDNKTEAELALLQLQQKQHQTRLQSVERSLGQMLIRAPHDGVLIHARDWGEPLRVGATLWPGRKIAVIPDMNKLQAKLHVLESEALGLAAGQSVTLRVDALPELSLRGTVTQVDKLAKPRQRNNPVKYFELMVQIEQAPVERLRPGMAVRADILVIEKNNVLTVPVQALSQQEGKHWVWRYDGEQFIQHAVDVGARSQSRVEIIGGAQAGDRILLLPPTGHNT